MDTVGNLLTQKGSAVHTVEKSATVLQAVQIMCAQRVGAILIVESGHPIGIFSERDLMTRVILNRKDPVATVVEEVMSRELVCIEPDASVTEAMAIMTERRFRHLPVAHEGRVAGMVSIGDLVRWVSRNQEFEIRMLTDYISGRYPG